MTPVSIHYTVVSGIGGKQILLENPAANPIEPFESLRT